MNAIGGSCDSDPLANLAAISAMAKWHFVPRLPQDKPCGKMNKAA
jgi:hypothetical protein